MYSYRYNAVHLVNCKIKYPPGGWKPLKTPALPLSVTVLLLTGRIKPLGVLRGVPHLDINLPYCFFCNLGCADAYRSKSSCPIHDSIFSIPLHCANKCPNANGTKLLISSSIVIHVLYTLTLGPLTLLDVVTYCRLLQSLYTVDVEKRRLYCVVLEL